MTRYNEQIVNYLCNKKAINRAYEELKSFLKTKKLIINNQQDYDDFVDILYRNIEKFQNSEQPDRIRHYAMENFIKYKINFFKNQHHQQQTQQIQHYDQQSREQPQPQHHGQQSRQQPRQEPILNQSDNNRFNYQDMQPPQPKQVLNNNQPPRPQHTFDKNDPTKIFEQMKKDRGLGQINQNQSIPTMQPPISTNSRSNDMSRDGLQQNTNQNAFSFKDDRDETLSSFNDAFAPPIVKEESNEFKERSNSAYAKSIQQIQAERSQSIPQSKQSIPQSQQSIPQSQQPEILESLDSHNIIDNYKDTRALKGNEIIISDKFEEKLINTYEEIIDVLSLRESINVKSRQLEDEIIHNTNLLNEKVEVVESTCKTICQNYLDKTFELIDRKLSSAKLINENNNLKDVNIISLSAQNKIKTLYFNINENIDILPKLLNVFAIEIVFLDFENIKDNENNNLKDIVCLNILDHEFNLRIGFDHKINYIESFSKSIKEVSCLNVLSENKNIIGGCLRLWFKGFSKN